MSEVDIKILTIIVVLAILAIFVFFFIFPEAGFLFSFFKEDLLLKTKSKSIAIGNLSTEIKIYKTITPYRDWNTGGSRERIDFKTNFPIEKMITEINKKNPNLLTYPDILDVKEIGKEDYLAIVAKDSQGSFYPLIRIHKLENITFDLIDLNGPGSSRSLFLPTKENNWTSLKGYADEQFLIQHTPFRVLNLGINELLKVDHQYAYTVTNYDNQLKSYEHNPIFRIFHLDSGAEAGKLILSKDCFRLPRFLVDRSYYTVTENEEPSVTFESAEAWWDQTISINKKDKNLNLQLKESHSLRAPKQKLLTINSTFSDQPSELEKVALTANSCQKLNPKGALLSSQEKYPEEISASAFEACFVDIKNLPPHFVKSRCQNIKESTIFSTNRSSIIKISFTYFNPNSNTKTESMGYKLILNKEPFFYLSDEGRELNLIANVFPISKSKALLLARGTGPWNVFLLSDDEENENSIKYLVDFAFLNDYENTTIKDQTGEWVGDHKYVYFSNSGFLFRNDGSFLKLKHLLDVKGTLGVTYSETTDSEFKISIVNLNQTVENPYLPSEVYQKDFSFSKPCTTEFIGNISKYSFNAGTKWFKKNFIWNESTSTISLISECKK